MESKKLTKILNEYKKTLIENISIFQSRGDRALVSLLRLVMQKIKDKKTELDIKILLCEKTFRFLSLHLR